MLNHKSREKKVQMSPEVAYARKKEIAPRMIKICFYKNNTHTET